jgi:hypothetical protein
MWRRWPLHHAARATWPETGWPYEFVKKRLKSIFCQKLCINYIMEEVAQRSGKKLPYLVTLTENIFF